MKWNSLQIIEFLNIYEQYPILWNIKHKDHCNTQLKNETFQDLVNKLNEKKLIGGMVLKQIKAKIKSIKDVYRQELHKIEKSKRSSYSSDEFHTPKLAWFKEAHFLAEVLSMRSSQQNLDLSQINQGSDLDENTKCITESIAPKDYNCHIETRNESHLKMRPPATPTPTKRIKKLAETITSEISEAIHQLDIISQNVTEDKPFDLFGKYVASELRQLPQREAILLQNEIQNSITRYRLAYLSHMDGAFATSSNQFLRPNNDAVSQPTFGQGDAVTGQEMTSLSSREVGNEGNSSGRKFTFTLL